MVERIAVTTFYRFLRLSCEQIADLSHRLRDLAEAEALRGLCLIGAEGLNATVSGTPSGINSLKARLAIWLDSAELGFKDSLCSKHPFREFKVKIRNEIVTSGKSGLFPGSEGNNYLSPRE